MRIETEAPRPTNFTGARLFIQQRCLGTLAHELGNIASPVALVADVLADGRTAPTAAAGTLRLVATSLARATTLCRLLRGTVHDGAFTPSTISDTSAWWSLCAPYAEDMLPDGARADGTMITVTLPLAQYQALIWATVSFARVAAITRPTLKSLRVDGSTERATGATFVLRMQANAARTEVPPIGVKQLLLLAGWETRRAGGHMTMSDTDAGLECRITLPLPIATVDAAVR